jgi:hypothetical protein
MIHCTADTPALHYQSSETTERQPQKNGLGHLQGGKFKWRAGAIFLKILKIML